MQLTSSRQQSETDKIISELQAPTRELTSINIHSFIARHRNHNR